MVTIILQVTLPTAITQRWQHSAVLFGVGPDFRVIVLFGGSSSSYLAISETTLLLLSKSPPVRLYSVLIIRVLTILYIDSPTSQSFNEQGCVSHVGCSIGGMSPHRYIHTCTHHYTQMMSLHKVECCEHVHEVKSNYLSLLVDEEIT